MSSGDQQAEDKAEIKPAGLDNLEELIADAKKQMPTPAQYTSRFLGRYHDQEYFRKIVHDYMDLTWWGKLKLGVIKRISSSMYQRRAQKMVEQYVDNFYEDSAKALAIRIGLKKLREQSQNVGAREAEVRTAAASKESAEQKLAQAIQAERDELERIEQAHREALAELDEQAQALEAQTREKFDPEQLVREQLQRTLTNSAYIQADAHGNLTFDDELLVQKLEDVFLDEIIEGITRTQGSGFMGKVRNAYEGAIAYYDTIDDLSEMGRIDWTQSMIESARYGHQVPTYPHLIVGKPEAQRTKTTVDTAITVDSSGSMEHNNRWQVATKTTLATHALMRRLNAGNATYLSRYSNDLSPMTTNEMLRNVRPVGGTETNLALDWLLDTLKDSGPSLAYLVTDGYPNDLTSAKKAARRFRDHPEIMLRIFLIDAEPESRDIIREIGREAGPYTRVMTISGYQLGEGMITDIHRALSDMQSIREF